MSNVDLHPEDLLDKEILGELSDEERVRLEAHVAVCQACRFERMAREDFRAELALEAELSASEAGKASNPAQRSGEAPRRFAPFRRVALLAAAALLLVSAVAGAGWVGIQSFTNKEQPERTPPVDSAIEAPKSAPVGAGIRPPAPVESTPQPLPEPEPSALPPQAPVLVSPPRVIAESPARTPSELVPEAESPPEPQPEAKPEPQSEPQSEPNLPPEPTAAIIFAEANAARSSGDYDRAIRLYAELQSSFPSSAESRTTQAILGRLLLDRGDPGGALRQYDAYLRGGGGLREEAMVGRATALRRLGRSGGEAAAWTLLLNSYPSSAHAENARKRLAEISGP